jgi:hypothetical protein
MYSIKSKITMSITFNNIHREPTQRHEFESEFFPINSNLCTWVYSNYNFSLLSSVCSLAHNLHHLHHLHHNVTIHNEGVYIPFPSCALKLSNLSIQFYLPSLITINAFYLLRTRADRSRSVYILQVHLHLIVSFKVGALTSR